MAANRLMDFPELGDVYSDEDANLLGVVGYSWKDEMVVVHLVKRLHTNEGYTYRSEQMPLRELLQCCSPRREKFNFDFIMEEDHVKEETK